MTYNQKIHEGVKWLLHEYRSRWEAKHGDKWKLFPRQSYLLQKVVKDCFANRDKLKIALDAFFCDTEAEKAKHPFAWFAKSFKYYLSSRHANKKTKIIERENFEEEGNFSKYYQSIVSGE